MKTNTIPCYWFAGLRINRIEKVDEENNIVEVLFQVWDGEIQLQGHLTTYEEALAVLNKALLKRGPSTVRCPVR